MASWHYPSRNAPDPPCSWKRDRVHMASHVPGLHCHASRSQGTNFVTKIFNFRCFLPPATKRSYTTPLYYPKWGLGDKRFFCGKIPLNTATRGAATTIHALSKSTSARALHNDHHQCTHNIQEEDQNWSWCPIKFLQRTVQPLWTCLLKYIFLSLSLTLMRILMIVTPIKRYEPCAIDLGHTCYRLRPLTQP